MKILVISSNLIGDTVLSTGIIKHFLDKNNKSEFTFVTGPSAAQLYQYFPNLEQVIIVKKQNFNLHWLQIWKKCFLKKWDIIIDFRSSLLSYFLFHKHKYIFRRSNNKHQIRQLSDFFETNTIPYPLIYNDPKEIQTVENILSSENKHIIISPGGNWIPKIWPLEKFNQLLKLMQKRYSNLIIILVGSIKDEEQYLKGLIKGIEKTNLINIMGASLTLTSAYMKKSNLFIGNDSGLMHLAVASTIPTIGLFGPTNDKIYAPFGNHCYTLRTRESYENFKKISIDQSKSYMHSIEVKDVIDLIEINKLL